MRPPFPALAGRLSRPVGARRSSTSARDAFLARCEGTDPATGRRRAVLITGAASGMGLEGARLFAAKGFYVVGIDANMDPTGPDAMTGKSRPGLRQLEEELGGPSNVAIVRADVTDKGALETVRAMLAKDLPARTGAKDARLDVVWANAGIGRGGLWMDQPWQEHLDVVAVNAVGAMATHHTFLPLQKGVTGGLAFTTSSSSGMLGIPGIATYSASKHFVKGLTEALSIELAAFGLRASDTLPGNIDTPIFPGGEGLPETGPWRLIHPREVAKVVWASWANDPEGRDELGDSTRDRIHWYVPVELQTEIDAVVGTRGGAERIRAEYEHLPLWQWIKSNLFPASK